MADIKLLDSPADDTQTELRPPATHERDDFQKTIDGRYKNVLDRWVAAKHPAPGNSPHDRITVAKKDVPALKSAIRRAATFHKHGYFFFKDRKDANGTVTVKYVPAPKPVKAETNGTPEAK